DGNELTATDVANSLNYERYPTAQSAFLYTSVKNVAAVGRYTVVVTLRRPDPNWRLGGGGLIFEKKFADEHKGTFGSPGVLLMGTGPWMPISFDPTSGVELAANPHWWGGRVGVKRISVKFFQDQNSMALAFRAGEIDVTMQLPDPRSFAGTAGTTPLTAPT